MSLRRWLLKGIGVSVIAVIGVLFVLHEDGSADADVFIERPPADVWKVVSNGAAYSEWNPFITHVDGDFKEGETIRIVLGTGPDSMGLTQRFCSSVRDKAFAGAAVYGFAVFLTVHIAFT